MRRLTLALLVTACTALPLSAEEVRSSTQALTLALEEAKLGQSETVRIQSIDSTRFRNGQTDWRFELRDGAKIYEARVEKDGSVEIDTDDDPDGDRPAFWARLPAPSDISTVEAYVERAKTELTAAEATLVPRDQYIVRYEVCDVPGPRDETGANGCEAGAPREAWSVVLKADVTGTSDKKNRVVIFEDGETSDIASVRVGGNW